MAKKFNDIKFTAAEKRCIEAGWYALSDIADMAGHTGRDYLRKALKLETTGPDGVPPLFAKGMLCGWAWGSREMTVADLYGRREGAILVHILMATASPTHIQLGSLRDAEVCKEQAFGRRKGA